MKSLTHILQQQKDQKKKLFIPYIMAGANGLERLEEEIEMLVASGASAIELGVPFSDPVADGPVIQLAGIQSRKRGTTLNKLVKLLQNIHSPVPLILMGYANSFFHYGMEKLLSDLSTTDVKGMIIPDLPYEHRDLFLIPAKASDIAFIQLVTLTSSDERIEQLVNDAEGFVYAVTINGITGKNTQYQEKLYAHLKKITEKSPIPVLAGFGVSTAEHVTTFNQHCDGVIIGSYIVNLLDKKGIAVTQTKIKSLFN
ncbi:tryptophan synthase subunit alpha [Enterococcus saccharolyticus]|uniref:Tryptophan synthase alpha chain n=1 Tax=Candidatus Enterococcus willemsii TaxID=1857215 RepID=A0ABQ6Z053_9ENTE|nr:MULTISPECIES: tryptophan synthase subunit alpha [Enterococcus]KAF1304313.1 tryptophan synthase subunit alpha [Enterococcus sp. CU12B]MCD5002792.1 tryptophan synthase subunit alpha [Enterococcus saccharolyticus]